MLHQEFPVLHFHPSHLFDLILCSLQKYQLPDLTEESGSFSYKVEVYNQTKESVSYLILSHATDSGAPRY